MRIALTAVMVLVAAALGQAQVAGQTGARSVAVVRPTEGNTANGIVRFEQTGESSVKVTADLKGLPPSKTLGFHIHEFGDLSAPDGTSAGGHYNPEGHLHAGPDAPLHHAGDLGNIESDPQGNAHKEVTVQGISISGPRNPIVGRSVIVHAGEDDLKSQPTGNAGARIAGGVIGIASTQPAK